MDNQKPTPLPDPHQVFAGIAQKIQHLIKQDRLVLDGHIAEFSELSGFADYLLDTDCITLKITSFEFQPKLDIPCIHIDATIDVFGFSSLAVDLDFLLIDDRITLRFNIPFPAKTKLEIPGISGFSVREIVLRTGVWLDTGAFEVRLEGNLYVGSSQLSSSLLLPVNQSNFQLSVNGPIPLPGIHEASSWFGDKWLSQYWPAFLNQPIVLKNLNLAFNPSEVSVDLLSVQLAPKDLKAQWQIIPDLLILKSPLVTLAGLSLADKESRSFSGSLSGIMRLCGIDVLLSAAKAGSGEWLFEGRLAREEHIQLSALLGALIPGALPLPDGVPDLTFSDLEISLNASTKSIEIAGSIDAAPAWNVNFPGLGSLSINHLHLSLSLQEGTEEKNERQASCTISGKGSLALIFDGLESVSMSGTATFHTGSGTTGFSFASDKPGESRVSVPLGPAPGPSLTCCFNMIDLSHTSDGWQLKSETQTSFKKLPAFMTRSIPGTKISIVPKAPKTWQLTAGRGEFLLSAKRLWDGPPLSVPLPSIHIGGKDYRLGTMLLDVEQWRVGRSKKKFELETTFRIAVSEEINRVFGIDEHSLKPKHKVLKTYAEGSRKPLDQATTTKFGISPDAGVWAFLQNSPFNGMQPDSEGLYHIQFGENGRYGQVALKMPRFLLSAAGWSAAGEWHIEKPLSLPLLFFKSVLTSSGLGILAEVIPDTLPLMDIQLVKDEKLTFTQWLEDIHKHGKIPIPPEVATVLKKFDSMSQAILQATPGCLNDYFNFSMPTDIAFEIQTGPGGGGALQISTETETGEPGKPLRLLLPLLDPSTGIPELVGVQLRSISVSEILGGSLFPISVDAICDRFDLLTILTCVIDGTLADQKTSTKKYRHRLVLSEVLAVLPAGSPVPIPLFYKELGLSYFGWEMVQMESHWHYPLPPAGLLESIELFRTIKDFLILKDKPLPKTAPKGFDLPFTVGPNYLKLPSWLGGGMLGTDKGLPQWNIWTSLANLLNGLKFGDPQYFLDVLPVQARIMLADIRFAIFNVDVGVAITSPEEFRTRIIGGRIETEPGKRFAKYLKRMGDGPDKQIEALLPKTPDHPTNQHGLILLLLSEFDMAGVVNLSLAFGLAAISSKTSGRRFATGVQFAGVIGKTLKVAIRGSLLIAKDELKIVGDSGIWWNDEPLTELGLTTIVSDTSFSTRVSLQFTRQCRLKGCWLITRKSMRISGELDWKYQDNTPLNVQLAGTFSTNGLKLGLEDKSPAIYGITVADFALEVPVLPGKKIQAAIGFAIPPALSDGIDKTITGMARNCQQELKSAAHIAVEELEKLSRYELSVDGISKMMSAICRAVVKGINAYVNKLKEPKHTIAEKAVKSYISTLKRFAGKFDKHPNKKTLGNDINDLIHWANKNRNKTIPIPFSKNITIPIIDGQTMKNLTSIQGKLPNWMAHLPEHNIGLRLSGRILQYAKNTVNHALNDIAENIGKETAKMPHLQALSLTTELITIPTNTNVLLTVTRNNTEKHFSAAFNFNKPAEATATLVDLIVKELPHW